MVNILLTEKARRVAAKRNNRVAMSLMSTLQDAMLHDGLAPADAVTICAVVGGLAAAGCRPEEAEKVRGAAAILAGIATELEGKLETKRQGRKGEVHADDV